MEESILFAKKEKTKEELEKELKNPLIAGEVIQGKHASKQGYLLRFDQPQAGVESNYYWLLRFMQQPGHFGLNLTSGDGVVLKLKDLYTAGSTSAYWGAVEQRKSIQQEKATNLMITIGKMLKDSFQVLRELRILDERIALYEKGSKEDQDAENALKDVWITVVEKGTQNPSSIYGMATKVGFVTLPQLFMKAYPKSSSEVDKEVKKFAGINKLLQETLARKLMQYMIWREKTYTEVKTRKNFMLSYLRQHYNAIRVNMNWLRPYLQNIQQLQMKGTLTDEDISSAFETSKIEIELLGKKLKTSKVVEPETGYEEEYKFIKYFPCVFLKIKFIAIPQMVYTQEQQRGPMHMGRTELIIQGYVLTEDEIEEYKKKIENEDIEMIGAYASALGALEEDLVKYLKEGGELLKEAEKDEKKPEGVFEPITGIFKGFKELFGMKPKEEKKGEKPTLTSKKEKEEIELAKDAAKDMSWNLYHIFKKGHGMITP